MSSQVYKWKREIHQRDNYTCFYCGDQFDYENLHVDHIIPKYRGGKTRRENLATACIRCNLLKETLSIEKFHEKISKLHDHHKEQIIYCQKILQKALTPR